MFHSAVEASQKSWFFYEPFTLISAYRDFQEKFVSTQSKYGKMVGRYATITNRKIFGITKSYLRTHTEVAEENIALLKNAIALWRTAGQTNDAIAPILFHYSWHCFNSFFAYTFLRWDPQHSNSHGIYVSNFSDDVGKIKITIKKDGLFQRLVDTWTCLGTSSAFSEFIPFRKSKSINFQPNQMYFLKQSNCIELDKLLKFNPTNDYERYYWKTYGRKNLLQNTSFRNSMNGPTRILRSYLMLFVASSIARYRPILWSSVLSGSDTHKSALSLEYRNSLLAYAQFGVNSVSFLQELSRFMTDLQNDRFEIGELP